MADETSDLLDDTIQFLRRFIVFSAKGQATAVALWIMHAHAIDAWDITPYLSIQSPQKQSGKSLLLDLLELLVPRPWGPVVAPSEAVVYSHIDGHKPTFLLDEVDTIFSKDGMKNHEGLRALLNAGHRRGVSVPRVLMRGQDRSTVEFQVFCPKAIAGIGELPDTVADRSITIRMERKLPSQQVESSRRRLIEGEAKALRTRMAAWAKAKVPALRDFQPQMPDDLSDRAMDNWEPLLAIAEMADKGPQARAIARRLYNAQQARIETEGELLLRHIREAFDEKEVDRISSTTLLNALCDRDDGPWAKWWGKDVFAPESNHAASGAGLNRMLKPYDIRSRKMRIPASKGTLQRGYQREWFEDAWGRYL